MATGHATFMDSNRHSLCARRFLTTHDTLLPAWFVYSPSYFMLMLLFTEVTCQHSPHTLRLRCSVVGDSLPAPGNLFE